MLEKCWFRIGGVKISLLLSYNVCSKFLIWLCPACIYMLLGITYLTFIND